MPLDINSLRKALQKLELSPPLIYIFYQTPASLVWLPIYYRSYSNLPIIQLLTDFLIYNLIFWITYHYVSNMCMI